MSIIIISVSFFHFFWHELEDAEERASQAENQLSKVRAKNRSTASVGRGFSPQVSYNLLV